MKERRAAKIFLLGITLAVAGTVAAVAHDPKDWPVPAAFKKMKNPVPRSDAAVAAGKALYNDQCISCHGEAGKGDGPDAMMYEVHPADLSDAHMMGMMSDGEIFYKISEGRKPMPDFKKKLSDEQRWQLVHFVRTLAPKMQHAPAAKKPATKKAPASKDKSENRK
ncbi:MAG: c-type cytochrome [Acidobacteria bacterium]|nr:c-type cytochrome [Acidobacteriota bacterium]MCL5288286.1 c-type cytochrome [Acidobacteriota bacterium]